MVRTSKKLVVPPRYRIKEDLVHPAAGFLSKAQPIVRLAHKLAKPSNRFAHLRAFPTAAFKDVVRTNVDTLYSSAFLDLARGPVVLSVPDTHGRYYLLPMLDAWTNVCSLASPGSRTTGTKPGTFVITGPDWSGTLPEGMHH